MASTGLKLAVAAWAVAALASQAHATCVTDQCYSEKTVVLPPPTLTVTADVTQLSSGLWDYVYTVHSSGHPKAPYLLGSFSLQLFDDAQITDLGLGPVPASSTQEIAIVDAPLGAAPRQISAHHGWPPGYTLPDKPASIRFTSSFAPTTTGTAVVSIYSMAYTEEDEYCCGYGGNTTYVGTVPGGPQSFSVVLPGSPLAIAAAVPEPSTALFFPLGLAALVIGARRLARREAQEG